MHDEEVFRCLAIWVVAVGCRYDFDLVGDATSRIDYRTAVLADHPVAYWRLDEAGSTIDIVAGNVGAYAGSCTHGVTGALTDDPDLAARFDGATCEIRVEDRAALQFPGTAPFTLEAWVSNTAPDAYYHYVTRETRVGGNPIDGYALFQNDSAPPGVSVERSVGQGVIRTNTVVIATGRFVHLVGTYDSQKLALYIDGTLAASVDDSRSMPTFADVPLLGAHSTAAFFDGVLDEVAIYDHVLAPERIAFHHLVGTAGPQ